MYQYKITFKSRSEPDIYIPAHTVESRGLLSKFIQTDEVVEFGGTLFRCSDVKRVTKEWVTDYKAESPKPVELSEEERQRAMRRLRWIRTYILTFRQGSSLEGAIEAGKRILSEDEHEGYERFVRWYQSPEQTEQRQLRDQFRSETFDTHYPTHEAFGRAFKVWLERRGQTDLVSEAEALFGVPAV